MHKVRVGLQQWARALCLHIFQYLQPRTCNAVFGCLFGLVSTIGYLGSMVLCCRVHWVWKYNVMLWNA